MDRTSGGLFYRIVDGNAPAVVRALGPNVLEPFVLPCTGPQYRRSRLATTARPSRLLSFPRAFRFGLSGTHAVDGKSRSPWITSPLATSNSKLPLSGGDLPDVLLYLPQRPLQNIIRKSGKHVRHDCATSHPKGRTQAVRVAENASASPCAPDPSDARLHLSSSSPGQSSEPPGSAQDFLDSPPCLVAAGVCADKTKTTKASRRAEDDTPDPHECVFRQRTAAGFTRLLLRLAHTRGRV